MSRTVTFEGEQPKGMINFGVGQPSADLLPVALFEKATNDFFQFAHPQDLNYGALQGDQRFRDSLANFLGRNYGKPVDAESLFLTGGNSQALDFICTHLSKPGDAIIVEEPSYFLAFQIFRDHGLNIISVPVNHDGFDIGALEAALARTKPRLIYTIPTYQNPSGQTMSAGQRKRLVELSHEHDFLILADEVYQLLSYDDSPPDALGTYSESGTILSLGSFSKILAPGLRLGWIQTSVEMAKRLTKIGAISSGGSLNHFTSHVVRHAIDLGLQQKHLDRLRRTYRGRVAAMDSALKEHFSEIATWTRPNGGYFFWLKLNRAIGTQELQVKANQMKTGFQPGELFSDSRNMKNHLRLSFAHYNEIDIHKGIARLRFLFD